MLNCFCYTGGFSLAALAGGARSRDSIDSSGPGARTARASNCLRIGFDASRAEWIEADVFRTCAMLRDQGRSFDLIVLDPPKFAPTAEHAPAAARAYKDINLQRAEAAAPGRAAGDVFLLGRRVRRPVPEDRRRRGGRRGRVGRDHSSDFGAAPDHPVLLEFPEGEYLKGLLCCARN